MENQGKMSVLMFPWLAHGHMSPYLELAKKLTTRNFAIYLCSTPVVLNSTRQKLNEKFLLSIKLVELHLPDLPELPPHYHTTNGLPPHLMPNLKEAFDESCSNFCDILKTLKPDLLIYDFLQPWAPKAAAAYNIPAVEFISSSATMTAFMLHVFKNPGIKFPFSTISFRQYEISLVNKLLESAAKHKEEKNRVIECLEESSKIVLIKSFKEIEGKYSDYITYLSGKKVVPVGTLVQDPMPDDENSEIIKWLNKKEKKSTVFVSFGSEYFLTKEDIEEIAHGLERSGVNFIWVLRFPKGDNRKVEEALPDGFFNRVGGRGKVVEGWAPQVKILGHSSIGGFVSHCGWSSILESMTFGVPIIAMPMHLDQPINARLVEEVGAGVEVVRDKNGKLKRQKLAVVIKQVMKKDSGELVRKQARILCNKIEARGEDDIDTLVEELLQLCVE